MTDLRIREAVRGLLIDTDQRVLLVRFEFPAGTRWALPGGGVEPGEDHYAALRRELLEEVGLAGATIGPHIWSRVHIIPFLNGRYDGQREQIHLVTCQPFEPQPTLSWAQLNDEYVFGMRWWTTAEIRDSDAVFVPAALAELLDDLVRNGPPSNPVDVSV
jgi:8-oxo-dGTP pyrophosphatase MutT (NUDIX family)